MSSLVSTRDKERIGTRAGILPRPLGQAIPRIALSPPLTSRRRRGIVVRRDFVRGAKMDFRETPQRRRPFLLDNLARGFLYRGGNATPELHPKAASPRVPASR